MANANTMNQLLPFPTTTIRPTRQRSVKTAAASGPSWWAPLLGWSSEPDYIDGSDKGPTTRFAPGCFTAEKAKKLRMMTKETASFHDVMYHSAIASRLALDSLNVNTSSSKSHP